MEQYVKEKKLRLIIKKYATQIFIEYVKHEMKYMDKISDILFILKILS